MKQFELLVRRSEELVTLALEHLRANVAIQRAED